MRIISSSCPFPAYAPYVYVAYRLFMFCLLYTLLYYIFIFCGSVSFVNVSDVIKVYCKTENTTLQHSSLQLYDVYFFFCFAIYKSCVLLLFFFFFHSFFINFSSSIFILCSLVFLAVKVIHNNFFYSFIILNFFFVLFFLIVVHCALVIIRQKCKQLN